MRLSQRTRNAMSAAGGTTNCATRALESLSWPCDRGYVDRSEALSNWKSSTPNTKSAQTRHSGRSTLQFERKGMDEATDTH